MPEEAELRILFAIQLWQLKIFLSWKYYYAHVYGILSLDDS